MMLKPIILGFLGMIIVSPAAKADDTLMDILYRDQRASHLDTLETQKIMYEERASSYLDGLYNAAYGIDDSALSSLSFDPHVDNVDLPAKPDSAGLKVDTKATGEPEKPTPEKPTEVKTNSGAKFVAGGQLDVNAN